MGQTHSCYPSLQEFIFTRLYTFTSSYFDKFPSIEINSEQNIFEFFIILEIAKLNFLFPDTFNNVPFWYCFSCVVRSIRRNTIIFLPEETESVIKIQINQFWILQDHFYFTEETNILSEIRQNFKLRLAVTDLRQISRNLSWKSLSTNNWKHFFVRTSWREKLSSFNGIWKILIPKRKLLFHICV